MQIHTITDDFGGDGEARTIRFVYNDEVREIDLNEKNEEEYRSFMQRHFAASRPVAHKLPRNPKAPQMRDWAIAEGMTVSKRGRISSNITAAYNTAHGNS